MESKHQREIWRYLVADTVIHAEFDTIQECGKFEAMTPLALKDLKRVRALVGLDHLCVRPYYWPAEPEPTATAHNFAKPFNADDPSTDWTAREALMHALTQLANEPHLDRVFIVLAGEDKNDLAVSVINGGCGVLESMGLVSAGLSLLTREL